MQNLLKNRMTLGIACIVLSLIICFGLTPMYSSALRAKTEIIRVIKDIEKGELITKDMIEKVEVGKFNMPLSVIKSEDDVIGKYAKADLLKGDYILHTKLSQKPLVSYKYLYQLDGQKRAISVSIKSFAAGLSGKLAAGDIVSVIACDYGEARQTVSPPELYYVKVLAVTAATGLDVNEYRGAVNHMQEEKELPATITLMVSPEQAKLLAELETKGKIHFALVYRGSEENAQKFLEEQNKVLQAIYHPEDEKSAQHID